MTRFSLAAPLLLLLCGIALAQTGGLPPTAPGNPTATVYSPTAAGLLWQRSNDDSGPVTRYEVTRDGTPLGIVNALSYIDSTLRPGRGYNYAIVAIDSDGQRSSRALVRVDTPDLHPLSPTNVRSSIYSSTAAELFWNRSPVFGQRYEVRRDGVSVTTTSGTSYFDASLVPGTRYQYEVLALNRQGQRSLPSHIVVYTGPSAGEPPAGPSAPSGLRADVYSQTAAEVFWNRPPTPGLVYEVSRNGESLARTTGTSLFDDSLIGGQRYTYDVVAISARGERSPPSSITLDTPGTPEPLPTNDNPYSQPDPDAANVVARLGFTGARELADDLVSTSYLKLYYDIDPMLTRLMSGVDEFGERGTLDCPGGGTVEGIAPEPLSFDAEFDDCVIDDHVLSGNLKHEMSVIVFGGGGSQEVTVTFDAFSIDAGNRERLTLSGTSVRKDQSVANAACSGAPTIRHEVENRIDNARVETAGDTLLVENASWKQSTESSPRSTGESLASNCQSVYTLGFRGEAFVESIRFGRSGAEFTKSGSIVRDPREAETSSATASLSADFGDRSRLTIAATSDDAGEAQVDITVDDTSVSFVDNYRFEARDDIPSILGD